MWLFSIWSIDEAFKKKSGTKSYFLWSYLLLHLLFLFSTYCFQNVLKILATFLASSRAPGSCSKKDGITNTKLTLSKLSFFLCVLFTFCSLTPYLSLFFVSYRKKVVFLNLISRYMTSASAYFWKSKDIVDLCKVNILYQQVIHSV